MDEKIKIEKQNFKSISDLMRGVKHKEYYNVDTEQINII